MGREAFPVVEAEVTLLPAEEGGRSSALRLDHPTAFYRPHVVVGDVHQRRAIIGADRFIAEEYLGVQFQKADLVLAPGSSATLRMDLIYYPELAYDRLQPGVTFTVREGAHIVGYGRILRRNDAGAI
jgi:hypothetical protein